LHDYNKKRAEALCQKSSKYIFDYLVYAVEIFPTNEYINNKSKENWARELLYTKIEFDINKNISKRSKSENSLLNENKFEDYQFYMNFNTIPYLHYIFMEGIKQGKITFESIISYLKDNSWIGKPLNESNSCGEIRQYNWLHSIAPSLHYFFNELEPAVITEGLYNPSFILSIDSLSLKFEGILRDFAKRIEINTVKTVREETREMFTEDILREGQDKLAKFFNDSELLLFHYIYTKQGINLRNDIAHCYFKHTYNYNVNQMYLLIVSLLKLGKSEFYIREYSTRRFLKTRLVVESLFRLFEK